MTSTQQPVPALTQDEQIDRLGRYEYGWADADVAGASARRGLDEDVVRDISRRKNEPEWMLERRLKALKLFDRKPMPDWGSDLSGIDRAAPHRAPSTRTSTTLTSNRERTPA